jgi:hypothetical protein
VPCFDLCERIVPKRMYIVCLLFKSRDLNNARQGLSFFLS